MAVGTEATRTSSGLDEVVVCESSITLIDGPLGELRFRGYAVEDLAEHAEYLDVVHLLWHGQWPTRGERAAFGRRMDRTACDHLRLGRRRYADTSLGCRGGCQPQPG